jgi:hypothetical protein
MNTETKLTLTGALAILASDAVTTWLLAMGKFPSALCWPISIIVYAWATYRMAKYVNIWGAMAIGAFFGIVDATVGWKIDYWLAGNKQGLFVILTLNGWATIVFLLMLYGLTISLFAFLISALRNKRKTF